MIIMMLLGLSCAHAQDSPEVLEIRTEYTAVNQAISKCSSGAGTDQFCGYYLSTVEVNEQNGPWPDVGIYQSTERFWGRMLETEEGQSIGLRKIEIDTDRSNRYEHEEFLFNISGDLLFYFFKQENEGKVVQELGFYFKLGGQLIDYKEKVAPEEKEFQHCTKADFADILKDAMRFNVSYQASFR